MPLKRGAFRISLTYRGGDGAGKTTAHTDTCHGRFVEIRPNERLAEVDEFETTNPQLQGEMTVTIALVDKNGGTEVVGEHEGLPSGVSIADNCEELRECASARLIESQGVDERFSIKGWNVGGS